jgi:hypothetical protein
MNEVLLDGMMEWFETAVRIKQQQSKSKKLPALMSCT